MKVVEKAESRGSSPFVIRAHSSGRARPINSTLSYNSPTPPVERIIPHISSDDDYINNMKDIDKTIRGATERESSLEMINDNSPIALTEEEEQEKV